jgi:hypothetical protein
MPKSIKKPVKIPAKDIAEKNVQLITVSNDTSDNPMRDIAENIDAKVSTVITDDPVPNDTPDMEIVKTIECSKLGKKAIGSLGYQVGFVKANNSLHVRIVSNESGGYFSKEWVPIDAVKSCLTPEIRAGNTFSATALKPAYISRSQNNAGFLAAALKSEGFFRGVADKSNLLQVDMNIFNIWENSNSNQSD